MNAINITNSKKREETILTLIAISMVSKRLANRLSALETKVKNPTAKETNKV